MAAAGEDVHDTTAGETAEKLADMAGQAAAGAAGAAGEMLGEEGVGEVAPESNAWSFWFRALMAIVVVVACFVASKVIRGETPDERRLRLRAERRAKKKATQDGPDEIDKLLASIVRRQPGAPIPPNAVPLSGRGVPRGVQPGKGAGRGTGAAAAAARMATAGRGNGAGRGPQPPPPPGGDNKPKLRWDQSNDEVEIVIRVDPKVKTEDVKVDVTSTLFKLSLRGQVVIAGQLFKAVDPEGCSWQIDDPGPGHPKEVAITLLKAEPSTSRENWWRAPLKGLENRRSAQPTDPEMVRKAIEAIKAKSTAGAKLGAKPRSNPPAADGSAAVPTAATTPTAPAVGALKAVAGAGADAARGSAAAAPPSGEAPGAAKPVSGKGGKGGGKKKNRKKK